VISANYLRISIDDISSGAMIPDSKALIARSSKIKFETKLSLKIEHVR